MAIPRWRSRAETGSAVPVTVDGAGALRLHLHATGDRWISDEIRAGVGFEQHVGRALRLLTPPGATLLDVGANIGWFTVIGSRLVGRRGEVIAYEPEPENLRLLRANIRANSCRNVVLHAAAAGASDGRALLWRSPDNAGDHRLELVSERIVSVEVAVRRIDDDVAVRTGVTVVKIDTQGSEVAVLRGMQRLLSAGGDLRIIAEIWPHGLERCGSSADDLIDLLSNNGRRLWIARHDGTITPASVDAVRVLARTELAPDSERHADIISLAADDVVAHGSLRTDAAGTAV